jgi:exonuclease VII large subunit
MDSSKQQQGTFTDKPLTTAGGRQEAINKVKESWNENVADPARQTMDRAKDRMDENKEDAKNKTGSTQEGMFTDKPLTTPGGRQEAINKVKESWNENVADPAKQSSDRAKHSLDENKEYAKDKTGQQEGMFTSKPLTTPEGRQEAIDKVKESWNENVADPARQTFDRAQHRMEENKEQAKDSTEKSNLQVLKEKTNENVIEPLQRGYEQAKQKINETFSSDTTTNKTGQQSYASTGQENQVMGTTGSKGQEFH